MIREIERALGKGSRADDVALALSVGSAAIDEGRVDVALATLPWAKAQAPRVSAIREALGVALYLDETFDEALRELQAYRRMTGRVDQNHLIADCERALGKPLDHVAASADALMSDADSPADRRAEAAMVWAGALADASDLPGARTVVRRCVALLELDDVETRARVHYLAGDLADREGDVDSAIDEFGQTIALVADYLDVGARLERLKSRRN